MDAHDRQIYYVEKYFRTSIVFGGMGDSITEKENKENEMEYIFKEKI